MSEIVAYKDFYKETIDTINARRYKAYKSLNIHQIEHNFELGENLKGKVPTSEELKQMLTITISNTDEEENG